MRAIFLVVLLVAPLATAGGASIRPGDQFNGVCTLNFVFDGLGALAGKVYLGTAAHCVTRIGENASTSGINNFGKVAYFGDSSSVTNNIPGDQLDFALIEVKSAFLDLVVPDVLGHPGMPTGSTTSGATAIGARLIVSGWGTGSDQTAPTREQRVGVLIRDDAREYLADTMAVPGDSGGPLLLADGRALGTISRFGFGHIPPSTDVGPTLEGILAELADLGLPVALRAAS